jgi:hypothetical protein
LVTRLLRFVSAGVVAVLVAGCVGQRPTLLPAVPTATAPPSSGNAAVDALAAQIRTAGTGDYDARYTLVRKLGNTVSEGRAVRQAGQLVVTVADVQFFLGDNNAATCTIGGGCEPGIQEQSSSDYGFFSAFYGPSPADQIQVAMQRRSREPELFTKDVGGITASCVSIAIATGVETYCAAPTGQLAYLDRADVSVELVSITNIVDPASIVRPGG